MQQNKWWTMASLWTTALLVAAGAAHAAVANGEVCLWSEEASEGEEPPDLGVRLVGKGDGTSYNLTLSFKQLDGSWLDVVATVPDFDQLPEGFEFPEGEGPHEAAHVKLLWGYDADHIKGPFGVALGNQPNQATGGLSVGVFTPIDLTKLDAERQWWNASQDDVGLVIEYFDGDHAAGDLGQPLTQEVPFLGQALEALLRTQVNGQELVRQRLQELSAGCMFISN